MLKRCFVVSICLLLLFSVSASAELSINSPSGILIDAESGLVLFEKNADKKMLPASTTKIMTAILAIENCKADDMLTASYDAVNSITFDSSKIYISEGETLSAKDLIYSLLISSASDSANVLAEHVAGSQSAFAEMMNKKAEELGCTSTHFENAHGLDSDNHYTTARDLSKIAKYAMSLPLFSEIVKLDSCTILPTNRFEDRRLLNTTNLLLSRVSGYYYKYTTGIKTGYTDKAKSCLVSAAEKNNVKLIAVTLGGESVDGKTSSFLDAKTLFEYGFNKCRVYGAAKENEIIANVKIKRAKGTNVATLLAEKTVCLLLPENADVNDVEIKQYQNDEIKAPVKKGEKLGKTEYWYKGTLLSSVNMVADRDYEKSSLSFIGVFLKSLFTSFWFYFIVVMLFLIITWYKNEKRRRKRRAERKRIRESWKKENIHG